MFRPKALTAIAAALLIGMSAADARGFSVGDYQGEVQDGPGELTFNVEKEAGKRRVESVTVLGVAYTCTVGSDGQTEEGLEYQKGIKVKPDRTFSRRQIEVLYVPGDPEGSFSGKLKQHGKASGKLRVTGELDGAGSDCTTGRLEWKAERTASRP